MRGKTGKILLLLTAFGPLLWGSLLPAQDSPFTGPSNWGTTGLMEIPTARVMELNTWRVGLSQVDPYRYYYVAISPLKGLELEGRVTEILGTKIEAPGWQGYGNYKDKAVDLKYQFLPEGKYTPALAIGIMDPHGTRLYTGQYVVASKQIYPFDFTLGLGNGRFGKRQLSATGEGFEIELFKDPKTWWEDSQFFGGVQFAFSERLLFMAEYNPIDYKVQTSDPAIRHNVLEEPSSRLNFGLRWRAIPDWVEIDASYQRGNTVGINIFMPFSIGRPMIPIYDHPYKEPLEFRMSSLDLRIYRALMASGFGNIGLTWEGNDLIIDLENYKYFYPRRAAEVAVNAIAPILADTVERVTFIFKERDIPAYVLRTHREDMLLFKNEKISWAQFLYASSLDSSYESVPGGEKFPVQGIVLGYRPIFQLFLNDPSGFWKGKVGITGYASKKLWAGCFSTLGISFYPLANISTVNEPLSIPVRTDIVDYIGRKFLFDSWVIDQVFRFPNTDLFLRGTGGMLELQYTGIDLEAAYPLFGGRIFLGTNMALVKKRDPKKPWEFREDPPHKDHYRTTFLNLRIHLPFVESYLDLKYGRFLAGDVGSKVTVTKVIKGVQISAFYSFTDTDVFQDSINKGYHDKGVYVTIPFRLFKGTDTRAKYTQGISPWTRDVAQDINHFTPLFEFLEDNTVFGIDKGTLR